MALGLSSWHWYKTASSPLLEASLNEGKMGKENSGYAHIGCCTRKSVSCLKILWCCSVQVTGSHGAFFFFALHLWQCWVFSSIGTVNKLCKGFAIAEKSWIAVSSRWGSPAPCDVPLWCSLQKSEQPRGQLDPSCNLQQMPPFPPEVTFRRGSHLEAFSLIPCFCNVAILSFHSPRVRQRCHVPKEVAQVWNTHLVPEALLCTLLGGIRCICYPEWDSDPFTQTPWSNGGHGMMLCSARSPWLKTENQDLPPSPFRTSWVWDHWSGVFFLFNSGSRQSLRLPFLFQTLFHWWWIVWLWFCGLADIPLSFI